MSSVLIFCAQHDRCDLMMKTNLCKSVREDRYTYIYINVYVYKSSVLIFCAQHDHYDQIIVVMLQKMRTLDLFTYTLIYI